VGQVLDYGAAHPLGIALIIDPSKDAQPIKATLEGRAQNFTTCLLIFCVSQHAKIGSVKTSLQKGDALETAVCLKQAQGE